MESGKTQEAIHLCEQGLALYPDYATAYALLARAYRLTGDIGAAVDSIRRGLDRMPLDRNLLRIRTEIEDAAQGIPATGPATGPAAGEQAPQNDLAAQGTEVAEQQGYDTPSQPETEPPVEPEQPEIGPPDEPRQPEIEPPVEPREPEIEPPVEPEQPEIEIPVKPRPELPDTEPERPDIDLPEPETPGKPEIEIPEEPRPELPDTEPERPEVLPEEPDTTLPGTPVPEVPQPDTGAPEITLPDPGTLQPQQPPRAQQLLSAVRTAEQNTTPHTNGRPHGGQEPTHRHAHLRIIESAGETAEMPSLIWRSKNVRLIPGLEFTPLRFESKKDRMYLRTYKIPDPPPFPEFPAVKKKAVRFHEEPKGGLTPLEELARRLEAARIPRVEEEEAPLPPAPAPAAPERQPTVVTETIARIYEMQGAIGEAAKAYEALARQKPDQAELYMKKARDLRSKG